MPESSSSFVKERSGSSASEERELSWVDRMDHSFSESALGSFFQMKVRGASLSREIVGGAVVFLQIIWAVSVHARSMSRTGTICVDIESFPTDVYDSMDQCVAAARRKLVTGVCLAGMVSSLLLGLWANFPSLMVPGGSMSPYFAFSVVGSMGSGDVSYRAGCTAVFIEGLFFLLLSLSGLRSLVAKLIPKSVQIGIRAGLGLFLAIMALEGPHGLGIVVGSTSNLVAFGGCAERYRIPFESGANWKCDGGRMTDPRLWLTLSGMLPMLVAVSLGRNVGILVAMFYISLIMWIPDTFVTQFDTSTEVGQEAFSYFKKIVDFKGVGDHWFPFTKDIGNGETWVALGSLFLTDLLDSTATMTAVAANIGIQQENNKDLFYGERAAFSSDAVGTMLAACVGSSPLTAAMESNIGTALGAKTGIVALVGAFGYLVLLFFVPILVSIPKYAYTVGFLVGGVGNLRALTEIDWSDMTESCPAFIVAFLIPMTYSITGPLVFATVVAHVMWLGLWATEKVKRCVTGPKLGARSLRSAGRHFGDHFKRTVLVSRSDLYRVLGVSRRRSNC